MTDFPQVSKGQVVELAQQELANALENLPNGVTVEYQIIENVIKWELVQKPIGFTSQEEQLILEQLNDISLCLASMKS